MHHPVGGFLPMHTCQYQMDMLHLKNGMHGMNSGGKRSRGDKEEVGGDGLGRDLVKTDNAFLFIKQQQNTQQRQKT